MLNVKFMHAMFCITLLVSGLYPLSIRVLSQYVMILAGDQGNEPAPWIEEEYMEEPVGGYLEDECGLDQWPYPAPY